MGRPRKPAPLVPVGLEKILFLASREPGFLVELRASRAEAIERRGIRLTEAERLMLAAVSEDQLAAMARNLDSSERTIKRRGLMRAVATAAVTLAAGTGAGCGGAEQQQARDSVKLPPEACANDQDPTWGSRPHPSECEEREEPEAAEFDAWLSDEEAQACFETYNLIHDPPVANIDLDDEFPIPEEHRTILAPAYMDSVDPRSRHFMVSEEEVELANRAVVHHLARAHENADLGSRMNEKLDRVVRTLRYYYVQYYGVQTPDAREVVCNFFFVIPPNDCPEIEAGPRGRHTNWRTQLVSAKGGGSIYWSATFNAKTREITWFHINSGK